MKSCKESVRLLGATLCPLLQQVVDKASYRAANAHVVVKNDSLVQSTSYTGRQSRRAKCRVRTWLELGAAWYSKEKGSSARQRFV